MAVRQLAARALEKVWGRTDVPTFFGHGSGFDGRIGEIWFEEPQDSSLLVKYLFTSQKLSIQVHPSDDQARATGHSRGKDEAWYVLSAEHDAVIGAGFSSELNEEDLGAAALDGSIDALMTWHSVKPGDFFYVPAGTVHAIGAGLSVLEMQQNVDLTYRLFDYGRPRELQLEEGLAASRPGPIVRKPARAVNSYRDVLSEGMKIVIERLRGRSVQEIHADADAPTWLMPVTAGCANEREDMPAGTVWLADTPTRIRLGPDDCLLAAYAGDKARL
ncbi:class I mannose-6-phosphate isomerase [Sphingomonas sp. AR_OL41]|uniref:class I mannose-6-phosphate isomerase n=1 Tax=Sphingomonas sp. AR_OL41 TaxID=3042729 RepID=UPI00248061E8|nr:class I mannose-6-phosphate isomerase [Sphingomonas sp. AR_OL41]MDH7972821.1 class I mannose-6-phosphate isomerase [Sphingomonas sp. AR_OL41]